MTLGDPLIYQYIKILIQKKIIKTKKKIKREFGEENIYFYFIYSRNKELVDLTKVQAAIFTWIGKREVQQVETGTCSWSFCLEQ